MNPILENLYLSTCGKHQTDAEAKAIQASIKAVKAAEQRLTTDEFDGIWNAAMSVGGADCLDSFVLGFRMGVQLTLEGLQPVNWPS